MWRAKEVEPLIQWTWHFFLLRSTTSSLPFSVLLLTMKLLLTFPFASLSHQQSLERVIVMQVWQWTMKWCFFCWIGRDASRFPFHMILSTSTGKPNPNWPQVICDNDVITLTYLSGQVCHSAARPIWPMFSASGCWSHFKLQEMSFSFSGLSAEEEEVQKYLKIAPKRYLIALLHSVWTIWLKSLNRTVLHEVSIACTMQECKAATV